MGVVICIDAAAAVLVLGGGGGVGKIPAKK